MGKDLISINRTMEYRYGSQDFRIGEPKSLNKRLELDDGAEMVRKSNENAWNA